MGNLGLLIGDLNRFGNFLNDIRYFFHRVSRIKEENYIVYMSDVENKGYR